MSNERIVWWEELGAGQYRGKSMDVYIDRHAKTDQKYFLDTNLGPIGFELPTPDTRSSVRKFYDDWKSRLSQAWKALKGDEDEDFS